MFGVFSRTTQQIRCDWAIQSALACLVDDAHTTFANLFTRGEVRKSCCNLISRGRRGIDAGKATV